MIPDKVSEFFSDKAVSHPIKDQALHQRIRFDGSGFYEPHYHVISDDASTASKTEIGNHIDKHHSSGATWSCDHPAHRAYLEAVYRKRDVSHARIVVDEHMQTGGCKAKGT